MLYLLFGKQRFLIEKETNKIIKDNDISALNISRYNLETAELKDILEDASTFSLFSDKKIIIVDNSFIFSTIKRKKEIETDELEKYLDNPNPDTIIIFISNDENINNVKKIVKKIKKVGKVIEFNDNAASKETLIKVQFKDYKIDLETLKLFEDRVGSDLSVIQNEIDKIKIYKDHDKVITKEDIENLIVKRYEIDIFDFIDKIIYKKTDEALTMYYEMLKYNEEPIKIISILADNFRLMYQAKELSKIGYNNFDIGDILEENPYRMKHVLIKSKEYSSNRLLKLIDELADLDLNIKTGKIDKELGLEIFIIKQKEII